MKKILVGFLIIALMLSVTACGKTKINMEDVMTLSFTGVDGYGSYSLDFDWDALDEQLDKEKVYDFCNEKNPMYTSLWWQADGYISLYDMLYLKPSQENGKLKNGDQISFEIAVYEEMLGDCTLEELEEGLGIQFAQTTISAEVSGLGEAETLEIFSVVEDIISFAGVDGYGTLKWDIPENHSVTIDQFTFRSFETYDDNLRMQIDYNGAELTSCRFEPSQTQGFATGDKCTITISDAGSLQNDLIEIGYVCDTTSKDFSVPELAKGTPIDVLGEAAKRVIYYGGNGYGKASFIEGEFQIQADDFYLNFDATDYGSDTENAGYIKVEVIHINERLDAFEIRFDKYLELSEGDQLYMAITNYETLGDLQDYLMEYGYVISEGEMTLTVPNLGTYANDLSEITQDHMADIEAQIITVTPENEKTSYSTTVYENGQIIIASRKPGIASKARSKLRVFYILKETETISSAWTGTKVYEKYMLMECGDLILMPDGTVSMHYSDEYLATSNHKNYDSVEEALAALSEEYEYTAQALFDC